MTIGRKGGFRFLLPFLLILALSSIGICAADTVVSVSPNSQNVAQVAPFTVDINVNPDEPIQMVQVDLSFDPTLVEANSASNGGLFGTIAPVTIDNAAGKITAICGFTTDPASSASGTLVQISFTSKTTDGTSSLVLSNVNVLRGTDVLPNSPQNGQVVVKDDDCLCDFCFELEAEWNMVSIPKAIEGSNTASEVFKLGYGEVCLRYDQTLTPYSNPWVQNPNIIPCEGYMVYKQTAGTDYSVCINFVDQGNVVPPELPVYKGWNLIGHPDVTSTSVDNFASFTGLSDTMRQLWHRSNDGNWTGYPNPDWGGLTSVTPGQGYWAFLDDDDTMGGTP